MNYTFRVLSVVLMLASLGSFSPAQASSILQSRRETEIRGATRVGGLLLSQANYQVLAPTDVISGTTSVYLPVVLRDYAPFDLSVSRVELIQGITMGDNYTVHIAGRPAFVRVFVNLSGPQPSLAGVSARLTRYVGGVQKDSLSAGSMTVQASTNEGDLSQTLNFSLPSHWLTVGTSYVLELDPLNAIGESNENNNRYPAAGEQSFNFVNADPLTVVIVPVTYVSPRGTTTPPTGDLAYLTWMPIKVFPVSQINYVLHAPHTFTGDLKNCDPNNPCGWSGLLQQIRALQVGESGGNTKIYFGLVDSIFASSECSPSCIVGIGYVGWPTSAGFAGISSNRGIASPTFTHEMGHNLNRSHAPCDVSSGMDGAYPYGVGAPIGQWGYDSATGTLYNPGIYKDFMSYCEPEWTSDYTYKAIADYRTIAPYDVISPGVQTDALYVSGVMDDQGDVQVLPLYRQIASVDSVTTGTHRAELLDANGQVLASQFFNLNKIAVDTLRNGSEMRGFHFFMRAVDGAATIRIYEGERLLFERKASGPAPDLNTASLRSQAVGGSSIHWSLRSGSPDTAYRIRFSPDGGQTWQVLALDQRNTMLVLPPKLLIEAGQPVLEVQATDGVRTDTMVIPLEDKQFEAPSAGQK